MPQAYICTVPFALVIHSSWTLTLWSPCRQLQEIFKPLLLQENLNTQNSGLCIVGVPISHISKQASSLNNICGSPLRSAMNMWIFVTFVFFSLVLTWKTCISVGIPINTWPKTGIKSEAKGKYQAVSEVSRASYTLGNMPSSTGFPVPLSRSLPHSAGKKEPSPTLCLFLAHLNCFLGDLNIFSLLFHWNMAKGARRLVRQTILSSLPFQVQIYPLNLLLLTLTSYSRVVIEPWVAVISNCAVHGF